jgi:hypothetical protein
LRRRGNLDARQEQRVIGDFGVDASTLDLGRNRAQLNRSRATWFSISNQREREDGDGTASSCGKWRIIDCKTAERRPAGITPEYRLQLMTYSMITPGADSFWRLDIVPKTKTVELVQQNCEIGPEERRYAETLYPMVQEAM